MKIYTKIGDKGKTTHFGYGMVYKDNAHIEVIGTLDELNSLIGVTLCFIKEENLLQTLKKIQNDLFTVGADLAGNNLQSEKIPRINESHVLELEKEIDLLEEKLGKPKEFILPQGTVTSSFLHLCRSVTRRSERTLVSLMKEVEINPDLLRYLNRLSDLFYVLARQANKEVDVREQQPIYKYFSGKEKREIENNERKDILQNQKDY